MTTATLTTDKIERYFSIVDQVRTDPRNPSSAMELCNAVDALLAERCEVMEELRIATDLVEAQRMSIDSQRRARTDAEEELRHLRGRLHR